MRALSADWNVDFGGLLQFIDADGHVQQAYTPRFNSLSLFKVPQLHSVSVVPAFVKTTRFALSGWARSGIE
jgi:SM-20-related protein